MERRPVVRQRPGQRPPALQQALPPQPGLQQAPSYPAATATATAAATTTVIDRVDAELPSKGWYRVEDAVTTAQTDEAFARFMAGDNPHLRTDEVPVVDFTSMIEVVGPDGRPVKQRSQGATFLIAALVAAVVLAALVLASIAGFINLPI